MTKIFVANGRSACGLMAGLMSVIYAVGAAAAGPSAPRMGTDNALRDGGSFERVAVFGQDDRRVLASSRRPLNRAIGLVFNNKARSVCTGFCVADSVIATAAHCLFRTAGERRPKLRNFHFVMGNAHKTTADSERVLARIAGYRQRSPGQYVLAGSIAPRVEPPIDATSDWALMRLDRPACKGKALEVEAASPAEIARYASRRQLYNVAFHRDFRDWSLAVSGPCDAQAATQQDAAARITRDFSAPEQLVLHTCDTGGASSGSPLMVMHASGKWSVVGLNVGTYVQTRVLMEKGRVIHRFKADAIANTAVAASAFSDHIAMFSASELISDVRRLRAIQSALSAQKLYSGRLDGTFGPEMWLAIRRYEDREGLLPTGLATAHLYRKLLPAGDTGGQPLKRTRRLARRRILRPSRGRLVRKFKTSRAAARRLRQRANRTSRSVPRSQRQARR